MLVDKRRDLIRHVARTYDNEGSRLFEGSYGLDALWKLLSDIIRDPLLPRVYLINRCVGRVYRISGRASPAPYSR